jgi:hypothetical protein
MIKNLSSLLDGETEERKVQLIVMSLGTTYRDFVHASATYNLVFMRGETTEFKTSLCRGLAMHFAGWNNPFWNKIAGIPPTVAPKEDTTPAPAIVETPVAIDSVTI